MNRTCHHLSDSHWTNSLQLVQQMSLFWMIRFWMLRCQKCFLDDTVLDAAPLDVSLLDAAIPRPWLLPIWMIRFWMLWSWMLQFWMFRSWMLWIIPKGSVLDVIWTFWSLDAKVLDVASLGCCALGCFNTHPLCEGVREIGTAFIFLRRLGIRHSRVPYAPLCSFYHQSSLSRKYCTSTLE